MNRPCRRPSTLDRSEEGEEEIERRDRSKRRGPPPSPRDPVTKGGRPLPSVVDRIVGFSSGSETNRHGPSEGGGRKGGREGPRDPYPSAYTNRTTSSIPPYHPGSDIQSTSHVSLVIPGSEIETVDPVLPT